MSNNYFQFKRFRVEQGMCALKVTTDACILGAWAPVMPGVARVLDIGAGTGLLPLMLAQREGNIAIDAVEIDEAAAPQARSNVAASEWAERINIITADACEYRSAEKYDMVISNPPFFNNSLLSGQGSKDVARHTLSLSYSSLLQAITINLSESGYAAILLPLEESKTWEALAVKNGWYFFRKLEVKHREASAIKRVVMLMSRKFIAACQCESLTIQDDAGNYTDTFTRLLQAYYLKL